MLKGEVKIYEIVNGEENLLFSDNNILTYFYRRTAASILAGDYKGDLSNSQLSYFQVGTSGIPFEAQSNSSVFFSLSSPITEAQYGVDNTLALTKLYRVTSLSGGNEMRFATEPTSGFAITISDSKYAFGTIANECRNKHYIESFNVRIKLDKDACNGVSITEVGLFLKNPNGYTGDVPALFAYKKLVGPILKRDSAEIAIDWSIGMLNTTNKVDTKFIGIDVSDNNNATPSLIPYP